MSIDKNIAAFSNVFGYKVPEITFAFALVPWESTEERNKFIAEMIEANDGQRIGD
jgi:hypothetical protein